MPQQSQRILAIIPAHREADNIGAVVSAMVSQGYDVLVVDDYSPDDTAAAARRAGAKVVRLPCNLGYGGALQTGYLYAAENGYDAVVQLDADGQHDPASAPDVLAPILADQADVVLGSRFIGGQSYPVPWLRRMGQRVFGGIAALITRKRITDPTTGYQGLSAGVVEVYCTELFPEDYPDADMLVLLHRMGIRVLEVPVKMYPSGARSMHSGLSRPLYYGYKMTLAIFMALIRKLPRKANP